MSLNKFNDDSRDAIRKIVSYVSKYKNVSCALESYSRSHSRLVFSVCGEGVDYDEGIYVDCVLCSYFRGPVNSRRSFLNIETSSDGMIIIKNGDDFRIQCEGIHVSEGSFSRTP